MQRSFLSLGPAFRLSVLPTLSYLYPVLSYLVLPYPILILSFPTLPCPVLPYLVLSYPVHGHEGPRYAPSALDHDIVCKIEHDDKQATARNRSKSIPRTTKTLLYSALKTCFYHKNNEYYDRELLLRSVALLFSNKQRVPYSLFYLGAAEGGLSTTVNVNTIHCVTYNCPHTFIAVQTLDLRF
jgi:hypothetical protein